VPPGKTTLVFPLFPVGRAKFLSQRNLDAAHISPGEICGLRHGKIESALAVALSVMDSAVVAANDSTRH